MSIIKVRLFSVLYLVIVFTSNINAQPSLSEDSCRQGIVFEESLTWNQVLAKASAENKYIFLDCYATWCSPCKKMDHEVYPLPYVGQTFNTRFISVKVQMDKNENDPLHVKTWYKDAERIQKEFTITSLPTLLFLFPDGSGMDKAAGFHDSYGLIKLATDAIDPGKQFYTLAKNFKPGLMDTAVMKLLARKFKANTESDLAGRLAVDYLIRIDTKQHGMPDNLWLMNEFQDNNEVLKIAVNHLNKVSDEVFLSDLNVQFLQVLKNRPSIQNVVLQRLKNLQLKPGNNGENYLSIIKSFGENPKIKKLAFDYLRPLSRKQLFNKANLEFAASFIDRSRSKYFSYFLNHAHEIDSIIGIRRFTELLIDQIILKEEVNPEITALQEHSLPNWLQLYRKVLKKYDTSYANRTFLKAKIAFYHYRADNYGTDWDKYFFYSIDNIEKYGADTTNVFSESELNNLAWDIFKHSEDIRLVREAVKMMEGVVRRGILFPANSLDTYANLLYKAGDIDKAIDLEKQAVSLEPTNKDFEANLRKMMSGLPTWK